MKQGDFSGVHQGSRVITLYVSNLPSKLHWSGLRHIFGFHGDVVDSFIASKLNKSGERFGFVRFSNSTDAFRAIERLDGFSLFGFRIAVSLARFNVRCSFWRKVGKDSDKSGEKSGSQNRIPGAEKCFSEPKDEHVPSASLKKKTLVAGECSGQNRKGLKCIQGHVDEESLSILNRCLIGKMATVCSTAAVLDRLHRWGLGEISIRYMGGRYYILEIKDDELFQMLKDLSWSYLLEVFIEIMPWSVSFHLPERVTWVEVSGLPLHCWNQITFKSIAEAWGSLVSLGENALQGQSCEKFSLLITTDQWNTIDEMVEFSAAQEIFHVRVTELNLLNNDHVSLAVSKVNKGVVAAAKPVSPDSSSESSANSIQNFSPTTVDTFVELEEDFNVVFNDNSIGVGATNLEERRSVGEMDIIGCREVLKALHSIPEDQIHAHNQEDIQLFASGIDKPSWAQVVRGSSNEGNIEKSLMVEGDFMGQRDKSAIGEPNYVGVKENVAGKIDTHGYSGVAEDIHFLGLQVHELAMTTLLEGESNVEIVEDQAELDKVGEKLSWEARVDALNGAFPSGVIECRVGRNDGCLDPMTNGSILDLSKLREMTCTKKGKKVWVFVILSFGTKEKR
ncbi:hypothetical protein GQ457_07G001550 [Hibiscus cannabinus]